MITAQEAKELSNSANGYYEQIEFYKEKVEQEIRKQPHIVLKKITRDFQ